MKDCSHESEECVAAPCGRPGSERIERYQQQILAGFTPAKTGVLQEAVAQAKAGGTFSSPNPTTALSGRNPAEPCINKEFCRRDGRSRPIADPQSLFWLRVHQAAA